MNRFRISVSIFTSVMLAASGAWAAECTGVNARVAAAPVIAHQVKDGATTMLIRSTGFNKTLTPAELSGEEWQHCVGMWIANPDGTGSGMGHCYSVDSDGDISMIEWDGANGKGDWSPIGGTGKSADSAGAGQGTWASGNAFTDNLNTGTWTGPCS